MPEQPTFDVTPPGWRPGVSDLPPGAENGQTFDEYRWSQLVEENKRNVSAIAELKRRLDELTDNHERLVTSLLAVRDRVDSLTPRVETIDSSVAYLYSRVNALEDAGKPPAKPVDELNKRIVAFLESAPDIKFTAISIRENIGGGKYIHDRCKTLVRQGLIQTHTAPNRHPLYQAVQKPTEDQSA